MKHGKKLKKFGRTSSHRSSLLMNLAISLFKHERIKTTLAKAKALRSVAEKLITKSKKRSLHTIRQLSSEISDKAVVKKLMDELSTRFMKRPGGYTRIYKCGFRAGDNAPVAMIELVDYVTHAGKGAPKKEPVAALSASLSSKEATKEKKPEVKAEKKAERKKEEPKKEVKKEERKKEAPKKKESSESKTKSKAKPAEAAKKSVKKVAPKKKTSKSSSSPKKK